eukprot:Em0016g74a
MLEKVATSEKERGGEGVAVMSVIRILSNLGQCGGPVPASILLSDELLGQKKGGQASASSSFEAPVKLLDPALLIGGEAGQPEDQFHGIFIRAPGIVEVRDPDHTKILATLVDGDKSVVQSSKATSWLPLSTQS